MSWLLDLGCSYFLLLAGALVGVSLVLARWPRWRGRILAGLGVLIAAGTIYWVHTYRFDPVAWKAASVESDRRWRMYDDLIRTHTLVGMTRAAVVELLGKPDEVHPGPFDRGWLPNSPEFDHYQADEKLEYHLGYGSSFFRIDVDVMYFYIRDGVVDRFGWHRT